MSHKKGSKGDFAIVFQAAALNKTRGGGHTLHKRKRNARFELCRTNTSRKLATLRILSHCEVPLACFCRTPHTLPTHCRSTAHNQRISTSRLQGPARLGDGPPQKVAGMTLTILPLAWAHHTLRTSSLLSCSQTCMWDTTSPHWSAMAAQHVTIESPCSSSCTRNVRNHSEYHMKGRTSLYHQQQMRAVLLPLSQRHAAAQNTSCMLRYHPHSSHRSSCMSTVLWQEPRTPKMHLTCAFHTSRIE
jgi:hypothetical protein